MGREESEVRSCPDKKITEEYQRVNSYDVLNINHNNYYAFDNIENSNEEKGKKREKPEKGIKKKTVEPGC